MTKPTGKAYLIGAGPGDPELITCRGRRLLGEADVVLYDYLANERLLDLTRPDAQRVCLGRHGHGRIVSQDEINEQLIAAARRGQVVVRLKGGDPTIFGRLAEEVAALEAANIPYEVVPGVSAAQAASAYSGIPLTHRDAASSVAFVTGRQKDDGAEGLDLAALAQFPGTLVFYMGVTAAGDWAAELVAHGKPPATPVAIVRYASLPKQQTLVTTLGELPGVLAERRLRPPAIFVVGEAVAARSQHDWFAARPLFGRTVMVTRPAGQADGLIDALAALGAAVVEQPAIEIAPPNDWGPVDAAIKRVGEFQWLVFSSANGVKYFFARLAHHGLDARALGGVRLAAIGPATAEAIAAERLHADVVPDEYRAESLAEALLPAAGSRVLLLRASRGREVLAETLSAAGAKVEQAVVYQSRDVPAADPDAAAALAQGAVDWVTVTSSAIARSLAALFGDDLGRARLAAISPITAGVLKDAGYNVAAVATTFTTAGLVEAMLAAESRTSA